MPNWLRCKWHHDWLVLKEGYVDDWCLCQRCGLNALIDPDRDMYVPEDQISRERLLRILGTVIED